MSTITKVKTGNREEWKALRRHYIGGSDAAAVVGLNPYRSQYSLWAEKTGRVPGFDGNLTTEVGSYLEEFVAKKFAEETGKKVRRANQSFLNADFPFAIANIDREIIGEDAGLEIKTNDSLNLHRFRGGEYPANYYVQSMHYMAVTGKERWYLAVLIGNKEFRWYTIERDEGEIQALMTAERMFWELVEKNIPPEPDGMKATSDTLKALYPESGDRVVDLYGYTDDIKRYLELNAKVKELEEMRDEAANRVKAFMGDAWGGECENFKVTWKTQTRKAFDSKAFAKANPDIDCSEYYKESTARVFRVKEI